MKIFFINKIHKLKTYLYFLLIQGFMLEAPAHSFLRDKENNLLLLVRRIRNKLGMEIKPAKFESGRIPGAKYVITSKIREI